MNKEITEKELKEFKEEFQSSNYNELAKRTVMRNGVLNSAYNQEKARELAPLFNTEVKDMPSVTNQKQSGRCWMFAALNVIRPTICKNLKSEDLELSESYLMFYDKLEKANLFLEEAITHAKEDVDSRIFECDFNYNPAGDGGFWHFFKDLVKKYGVCPKSVMDESTATSSSFEMNDVLNHLITKWVYLIRKAFKEKKDETKLRKLKKDALEEVYRVLSICIGTPVDKFSFTYKEKPDKEDKKDDKKDKKEEKEEKSVYKTIECTPKEFAETYLGSELDDLVLLINYPLESYPFYEKYQNKGAKNIVGQSYFALNLPIKELKQAAIKALKDNTPLWFACDVSVDSYRKEGYLANEVVQLEELFQIKLGFNKGERVKLRSTYCNHAMTLTGVHLVKNKPVRWKVQNSWGTDVGKHGIFVMSDCWFNDYVFELVVNKKYLSKEALDALNKKVKLLEPWDLIA